MAAQALAQRRLLDERLELASQVRVRAALEVGFDAFLERPQPQLLEVRDVRLREGLEGEVGEGRPTPQRERVPKLRGALVRLGAAGAVDEDAEPVEVELSGADAQPIAGRLRLQDFRTEGLAQLG